MTLDADWIKAEIALVDKGEAEDDRLTRAAYRELLALAARTVSAEADVLLLAQDDETKAAYLSVRADRDRLAKALEEAGAQNKVFEDEMQAGLAKRDSTAERLLVATASLAAMTARAEKAEHELAQALTSAKVMLMVSLPPNDISGCAMDDRARQQLLESIHRNSPPPSPAAVVKGEAK